MKKRHKEFKKKLTNLINIHSIDNDMNIPDFILATYICDCLTVYDVAHKRTLQFSGDSKKTAPTILEKEK